MKNIILSFCLIATSLTTVAQTTQSLETQIAKITRTSKATIGVAVLDLDGADSLFINNSTHYTMHSVFKFPLAIATLAQVDKGKLSLSQKIHIPRESLDTSTWSPMVKDFPNQDIDLTLSDLLTYTISKSDNNGCDILFRLMGGTKPVNTYIHKLGISGIAIAATEGEMRKAWNVQYTNWCTPAAMAQLLRMFYQQKLLSAASNRFLMKIMTESQNSDKRIKGLLPPGTVVSHKTGTSDTNKKGITAATNDVAIITMPSGRHIALVVYITNSPAKPAANEPVIAAIAKLVYDHYNL